MKKHLIYTVFVFIIFLSTGCQSESDKKREQYDKKQNYETNPNDDSKDLFFFDKTAILQKDDGWLYYLMIEKTKENETFYEFDGINMWRKISINECFIPVYDEKDNLVDCMNPPVSVLSLYEKSKHDVEKIQECLDKKTSIDIKREELKNLELSYIDIKDVEKLLSDLDNIEYPTEYGSYSDASFTNYFEKDLNDNNKLCITYLKNLGYLIALNIEVSDSGGKVLSELAIENNLNSEQEKLLEIFNLIEEDILQNQSLDISKYEKDLEPKIYNGLKTILKNLEDTSEESNK